MESAWSSFRRRSRADFRCCRDRLSRAKLSAFRSWTSSLKEQYLLSRRSDKKVSRIHDFDDILHRSRSLGRDSCHKRDRYRETLPRSGDKVLYPYFELLPIRRDRTPPSPHLAPSNRRDVSTTACLPVKTAEQL